MYKRCGVAGMADSSSGFSRWRSGLLYRMRRMRGQPQTREQLLDTLRGARHRELFGADALDIMEGALQVSEMQVRDIMVPSSQMVVVEEDGDFATILAAVVDSGHSRFPAIGDNRDEVLGILLAKELLHHCNAQEESAFSLREVLRPAVFIPESKRLDVLLREFRANRNHMAIVADEYGGVAGLVTIEDVLEQIVGDIADETDQDRDPAIRRRADGSFNVKALMPIEDFNLAFDTDFDDEAFDTVGGLVLNAFGHMPQRDERVTLGPLLVTVLNADSRRVHLLSVQKSRAHQHGIAADGDSG